MVLCICARRLLIALGKFEYYGSGGCQIGDSIDSHNAFVVIDTTPLCWATSLPPTESRTTVEMFSLP